jgi:ABC-type phosphate transport system substrate-binding protein
MNKQWKLVAGFLAGLAAIAGCNGGGSGSGASGSGEGTTAGEIVVVGRQNSSGTYAYFKEVVVGEEGEFRLNIQSQSGSKDVVELVSKTPNAIGYSGMGYATPEVKMLAVSKEGGAAVSPSVESALDGTYPIARNLYIYTLGEPEGAVKAYLDWILSKEGQAIVSEIGYVPAPGDHPDAPTGDGGTGTISVSGSDTMLSLGQKWSEEYKKKNPGVDPQVNGGGSGVGIKDLIDGTVQMAQASREIKPNEKEDAEAKSGKEVKEYVVGLDALAVFVHKENPLDSISISDLKEIYSDEGTITEWSQVTGFPKDGQ